ncbi:MAG: hypothetical protein IJ747_00975 [Lachnospiraceae bacterium]|nr:hypothetical protein [Lachnospiraceae bacterium]
MRGIKRAWLRLGVVLTVAGLILFCTHFAEGIASMRGSVSLYGPGGDFDKLTKYDHIRTDYDFSLGSYMEMETTTENKYGRTVGKSYQYYYAIPAYTEENTYWIGLEVPEQDTELMEQITDESYAFLMGEESNFGSIYLTKSGCLKKMDDEHYSYLKAMFADMGYTNDEIEEFTQPYYIATFDVAKTKFTFLLSIVLFWAGLVFLVLLLLFYLRSRNGAASATTAAPQTVAAQAPKGTMMIGNQSFPKEWFVRVDQYVKQNELEYAKQDLRSLTGITYEEAEQVIENWQRYYRS